MKNAVENTSKSQFIHLFISLPTNDVCSLRDISTKLPVHQVKSKIELRVGIPGDLVHLYFMNNEMADEKTLQDYKLKHGCILRVRLHKTWLGLFLACSKGDTFEVFQNGVEAIHDESSNDLDVELWNKLVVKRATFALFMATYRGYLSLMLELLNSSAADVNGCTIFGRTALHIAAFQGFVGCVSLLLSEGAECTALDVFAKTPLQLAHVNRHTYCQKRLYMHQSSGVDVRESQKAHGRPKTAPHKLMKNFHQNQSRKKERPSCNPTGDAPKETIIEHLPSITTPTKDPLIIHHSHTNPSSSHDLPEMTIIEPAKTDHLEDEIPIQFSAPTFRAQTAPVRREGSNQSSTSRGIRGIDAILRTAQDDVVGEYHNIGESVADVNMTTLKLSLPREEITPKNLSQPEFGNTITSKPENVVEGRTTQVSPNKKMLGFVITAEEKRSLNQGKKSAGCSETKDRNDTLSTPSTNSDVTEEQERDQKIVWTPTSNGYFEPNEQPDDRFWTPSEYDSILDNYRTTSPQHRKVGPALSYDAWLEKKRQLAKEAKTERPVSASGLKSKVGREMDEIAFKQWLEGKQKFRIRRSKSETLTIEHHRTGSGVPFEEWLRQKRQQLNESSAEDDGHITERVNPRPKQTNLGGKTFSEWLAEKNNVTQTGDQVKMDSKPNRCRSGKTFQEWLRDKNKDKKNEAILKENLAIFELEKKAVLEEERKLNPRVKTFEQWFEEKHAQSIIEFIQSKNAPSQTGVLSSDTKYPEDASLVFDMWLTTKNMEDLEREERLYEEMVEKWRKKEQERLLIRRGILSKLSQARKVK